MSAQQFAADLAWATDYLRDRAEARMEWLSTVTVRRKTGKETQNESTGIEAPVWTVAYTGSFRLDSGSSSDGGSRGINIGGITYEEATAIGHFPATTLTLHDDDLIEVTAGETIGTVWRIVKVLRYDQKTAMRLPLAEAQRPSEWV